MKFVEVPPECVVARCTECGDHLAIPLEDYTDERLWEMEEEHRLWLCPHRPYSEPG